MTEKTYEEYEYKCKMLLAKARLQVGRKGPYFSGILYSLVPVMVPGLGSLAVTDTLLLLIDPVRVVDDPELGGVDDNGIPHKLAGVLVHECMHILRDIERVGALGKIDKELANIAADLPINFDLRRAGWELPNWVVYPEKYGFPESKTMEQYFELLKKDAEKSKQKTYKMVADAKGQQPARGKGGKGKGKSQGGKSDPQPSKLDVGAGQCGNAGGNQSQAASKAAKQHQNRGRQKADVEAAKKKTLSDAKKFFSSPGRGDVPGWVEEELSKLKRKRKDRDWEKELNQVVRRRSGVIMAGGSDFSKARPSKRGLLRNGLLRPGLVEQQYEAALAIDTSGSMGEEQLNYAKNLVLNIMSQTGVDTIWLAQCDAKIQVPFTRIRIRDVPDMKMKGRGGTNFRPIFEALRKLRPKPDLIVVATDGDGPAPEKPPYGIDTIWVIVPSTWRRRPATWGHIVVCSNDHAINDAFSK